MFLCSSLSENWSLSPQNENFVPPADGHNTTGQYDPRHQYSGGMTSVSLANFAAPAVDDRVIQTTQDLPEEFPFNLDLNSGSPLGIGTSL